MKTTFKERFSSVILAIITKIPQLNNNCSTKMTQVSSNRLRRIKKVLTNNHHISQQHKHQCRGQMSKQM